MSMRLKRWLSVGLLVVASSVLAQDEPDFDPASDTLDAPAPAWRWFGELTLRGDRVTGLPGGREDLERARSRVRWGGLWNDHSDDGVAFGFALEGAIGTGSNKRSLVNNDVEDVDGLGLDQLWVRKRFGSADGLTGQALLGVAPLPLELSPMLWDDDLRPVGAGLRLGAAAGDLNRWQIDVGSFVPDPLNEREARLNAAQFGWHWREGAPTSAGLLIGYLDWSDLDDLARAGLGRGNSLVAGRYRFDYRLLDAQVYLRRQMGEKALVARLDRVTNLDADNDDDGTRASLVYGDRLNQPGWEFGWAWQRIQRDAVLAAMTADDWWFHTAARGHMPWVGYGINATWSLRVAGFFETRDGLNDRTRRLLIDLDARW